MARRPRAERKERKPRSERKPRQIAGRGSVVFSMLRNRIEDIRAAGRHQLNREPDGTSEIDPKRSGRNEALIGSGDILEDVKTYEKGIEIRGHKRDTGSPYLTLVLSASPEFFRPDGGPPGSEADTVEKAKRLKAWKTATVDWVQDTFGTDLVSAIYNGDETTPHIHFAIVPTYERKTGIKPRRLKDEEPDDHAARVQDWEMNGPTMRTRSWASNPVLGQKNSAERLRRSYADAMKPLGLEYALASYDPQNPDTPASHREFRDAERAKTIEDRKAAKLVKREAEKRNLRSKAVMDAVTALAAEIEDGTISYDKDGKFRAKNRAALVVGAPEITEAVKAVAWAATQLQDERAELALERAALVQEQAQTAKDRESIIEEKAVLQAEWNEVNRLRTRLKNGLAQVDEWLKNPRLPEPLAKVGRMLGKVMRSDTDLLTPEKPPEDPDGPGF